MLGKLGATYAYVVRNAGLGASSVCARFGGMVAPYIADLNKVVPGDFGDALPLVIFGGFSVAAGLLALFLPETLNKDLPETIEDAQQFGKKTADMTESKIYEYVSIGSCSDIPSSAREEDI